MRTLSTRSKIIAGAQVKLRNRRVRVSVFANGDILLKWRSLRPDGISTDTVRLSPEAAAATCKLLMAVINDNPEMYRRKDA
jgi:hypothetical protein